MDETTLLPKRIGLRETVYEDRVRRLYRVVAEFDGFTKEYFVSDSGQRAAVLVVRQDKVLLMRQYRLVIDRLSLEVPGGRVDEGETPENAAMRECQEETGIQPTNLKHLLSYHPGLDVTQNHTHIYCTDTFTESEDSKVDRRIWLPIKRCIEMVFAGEIVDGLTIIALLAYWTLLRVEGQNV